jgi:hypothetical protein
MRKAEVWQLSVAVTIDSWLNQSKYYLLHLEHDYVLPRFDTRQTAGMLE